MFFPSKDEKLSMVLSMILDHKRKEVKYPYTAVSKSVKSRLLAHLEIPDDPILIQHTANILSKPRDGIKCKSLQEALHVERKMIVVRHYRKRRDNRKV